MANDVFLEFEQFEQVEDGTTIVYGVNVLRVDAEVEADPSGMCVQQLVEKYREMLALPQDVVVFVDGEKYAPSDYIPAAARRIEILKPAGTKGTTDRIELEPEDAAKIIIVRQDTIEYVAMVLDGAMSEDLLPFADFDGGREVLRVEGGQAYIGHPETKATRTEFRTEAKMTRRTGSGLTINDIISALSARYERSLVEMRLNGEALPDGTCQELAAGDELAIVLSGETRDESFEGWAAEQRNQAGWAHYAEGYDRDASIPARAEELVALNWAQLRILGAKHGVKLAGKGRNADAIRADILAAEFPELPPEDEFVSAWLATNAPEALEA